MKCSIAVTIAVGLGSAFEVKRRKVSFLSSIQWKSEDGLALPLHSPNLWLIRLMTPVAMTAGGQARQIRGL